MEEVHENIYIRPMLNTEKNEIEEYINKYDIPSFKMRQILMTRIQETFLEIKFFLLLKANGLMSFHHLWLLEKRAQMMMLRFISQVFERRSSL
jgi:hypothetical protein